MLNDICLLRTTRVTREKWKVSETKIGVSLLSLDNDERVKKVEKI